jgi:putative flippase GtrA
VVEVPVIIPAYRPNEHLVSLVTDLIELGCPLVVVVDDGSGPEYERQFRKVEGLGRVRVLRHAVNLGKGAALKTAMNYVLVRFPGSCGVVTADADGQHHPNDILRVAERLQQNPEALIMGARQFGPEVPWKSRLGNRASRALMRMVTGRRLSDTQTGLRGIPGRLIPHLLRVPSSGYDFELDMLLACKYQSCRIVEEPIQTIYLDGNRSSHFNPVLDSVRIYLLLFRFSILSFCTAVLDNIVFGLAHASGANLAESQVAARIVAMCFNYLGARSVVFHSQQRDRVMLPKYVLLVLCSGSVSYAMIRFLQFQTGMRVTVAKVIAEGILFIANFAIQRDFVFSRRESGQPKKATDWDRYYLSVPPTAKLTRRYSTWALLRAIKRYTAASREDGQLSIVEIGGANSCFLDAIVARFPCRSYDVIDTNEYGLSLLSDRAGDGKVVRLHRASVLEHALDVAADVVFSVGLVEHFEPKETRAAVLAHFDLLRPGGTAIITFPTPTLLYRITRALISALGMWRFPDERALDPREVTSAVRERGELVCEKTLWPLLLTQHLIVARKGPLHGEGS